MHLVVRAIRLAWYEELDVLCIKEKLYTIPSLSDVTYAKGGPVAPAPYMHDLEGDGTYIALVLYRI